MLKEECVGSEEKRREMMSNLGYRRCERMAESSPTKRPFQGPATDSTVHSGAWAPDEADGGGL